ncbi:MAG: hypothetical protein KBA71_00280 [Opitutaceae bacterium]|nr:hypothetical protein [Opitutaceae bacterium]
MPAICRWKVYSSVAREQGAPQFGPLWCKGGTLVEVIVVVAIATLLMGASLAVYGNLHTRGRRLRAQAELAVLRNGLESFRRAHGEYPLTGDSPTLADLASLDPRTAEVKLFSALSGRLDARLQPDVAKGYVDWRQLSTAHTGTGAGVESIESEPPLNAFADPWGNPYVYRYRASLTEEWDAATCLLYSLGPDGKESPPVHGGFDPNAPLNRDNIHG